MLLGAYLSSLNAPCHCTPCAGCAFLLTADYDSALTVHPVQQVQCSLHPAADCAPLLTMHPLLTVHPVQRVRYSLHLSADCAACADGAPLLTVHPVQQVQYSLRSLLSWLEVPDVNKLHNAGNDARWATSLGRNQGEGQGRLWTAGGSRQRAGSRGSCGGQSSGGMVVLVLWHTSPHLMSRSCPYMFACDMVLMCCRYTLEALLCMCPH